jgi:beta-lactamase class D
MVIDERPAELATAAFTGRRPAAVVAAAAMFTAAGGLGCAHMNYALGGAAMPTPPIMVPVGLMAADPPDEHRCFTWTDLATDTSSELGGDECGERSLPASTFKIPNALVALDARVIDESTVLPWDGEKRWNTTWNRDQTLASAMTNSVLWYFQRVAARVGKERYERYLDLFDYGNEASSGPLTEFWLDGSLQISPREQTRFLAALYRGTLPVDAHAATTVRSILELRGPRAAEVRERLPFVDDIPSDLVLSGKTGSSARRLPDGTVAAVGWFVGALEGRGRRIVFADRIRSDDAELGGAAAARDAFDKMKKERLL